MALACAERRLLPRSDRSFRRKTESRSVRSYSSIHRYIVDGCLPNAVATALTLANVRPVPSNSRSGFRVLNRFTAVCHASLDTDTKSGVQAWRSPANLIVADQAVDYTCSQLALSFI